MKRHHGLAIGITLISHFLGLLKRKNAVVLGEGDCHWQDDGEEYREELGIHFLTMVKSPFEFHETDTEGLFVAGYDDDLAFYVVGVLVHDTEHSLQ